MGPLAPGAPAVRGDAPERLLPRWREEEDVCVIRRGGAGRGVPATPYLVRGPSRAPFPPPLRGDLALRGPLRGDLARGGGRRCPRVRLVRSWHGCLCGRRRRGWLRGGQHGGSPGVSPTQEGREVVSRTLWSAGVRGRARRRGGRPVLVGLSAGCCHRRAHPALERPCPGAEWDGAWGHPGGRG